MILSDVPKIRAFNVDCMEFMKDIPDKFYSLAIVDPPYGFENNNIPNNSSNKQIYDGYNSKKWDSKPDNNYFKELNRISINQIIWGGNYFNNLWQEGLNRGFIFWDKIQVSSNHADGELAWTSFDRNARLFRYCFSGNRYGYENSMEGVCKKSNRIHPTEKPIQLYKWLLKNYAKPNDTIFDSHGGSMSIAIACKEMGFDLDICELDCDYFNAAIKRFNLVTSQLKLF